LVAVNRPDAVFAFQSARQSGIQRKRSSVELGKMFVLRERFGEEGAKDKGIKEKFFHAKGKKFEQR
jgi:hypothetical protein